MGLPDAWQDTTNPTSETTTNILQLSMRIFVLSDYFIAHFPVFVKLNYAYLLNPL
jgi:hypothetical protein